MIVLVVLRIGVGFHFFSEGTDKLRSGTFSSAGFLGNAKGPLAPMFQGFVWDADGLARLNYAKNEYGKPDFNIDRTREVWDHYKNQVIGHYGFDDKQKKKAEQVSKQYDGRLTRFFEDNGIDILEYFNGLERRERNHANDARMQVVSLRGQTDKVDAELRKQRGPWLAQIDMLWAGYQNAMGAIATPEQRSRGQLVLERPGRKPLDSVAIDSIIPWFDVAVGLCLLLGLFTRTASGLGAAFLGSIILSQWPGTPGAAPVFYQSIEMLALLALATTPSGRFAGLDFFLHTLGMKCCPSKKGANKS